MTTIDIKHFKGKNYLETFGSNNLNSFELISDTGNTVGLKFSKVEELTPLKDFLKKQGFKEYQKYDETTNGFYTSGNVFYIYLKPEKSTSNSNNQTGTETEDSYFSKVVKRTPGVVPALLGAANLVFPNQGVAEEIQRIKKLLK